MHEAIQCLSQLIPRILMSGILVGVAFLCLSETVRLWITGSWVITPFAYFEKGVESKTEGATFAQQVLVELIHQGELLQTTNRSDPKGAAPPNMPVVQSSLPKLAPVELPRVALDNVEINVQGVNLSSLVRVLSRWINPPREITGSVSVAPSLLAPVLSPATTVQVMLQEDGRTAGRSPIVFRTVDHLSRESAVSATASHLLFIFFQQHPQIFKGMDGDAFSTYISLVKRYAGISSALREGRINKDAYTSAAKVLSQNITELSTRTYNSPAVLRLLIFSHMDLEDNVAARRDLEAYLRLVPNDKEGLLIKQELDKIAPQNAETLLAAAGSASAVGADADGRSPAELAKGKTGIPPQREIHRPIRPGISVGSYGQSGGGTLCCLVRNARGTVYALSSEHVLSGTAETPVLQPAPLDGGTIKDRIGKLVKHASPEGARSKVGALAEVEGVKWDARPKGLTMAALASPNLGAEVICLGRTTGSTRGKIVAVDMNLLVDSQHHSGVFQVEGIGGPFSELGDSGAPILSANSNNLIGMLYATNNENTAYCIPIGPILSALNVAAILGEEQSP